MSIKWMTAVWDEATTVKGTELLVLLCIADHASDDTGEAWPSVSRLSQRTRRSERSVQEALANLEVSGWLTRTMRPGHSTLYTIHKGGAADRTPEESAPPQPTAPHPRGGPHPRGAVSRTQNHQGTTNEPGGAVVSPTGGEADLTPASHTHVTPFPAWAVMSLTSNTTTPITNDVVRQWVNTWDALCGLPPTVWDPNLHLTKYLARCKELKRAASPAEWARWFAEDEMKAAREGAAQAKAEQAQIKPLNPYWE